MKNESRQFPDFDQRTDLIPFADIIDAENARINAAVDSGDPVALYKAMEAKKRAVEEWFPNLKDEAIELDQS